MIDPKKVLIATPSHDGKVVAGYAGGLAEVFASGFAGGISFLNFNSDVGAARCQVAHAFLQSPFDWLVMIDSDIQFSARDFGILMQVETDQVTSRVGDPVIDKIGDQLPHLFRDADSVSRPELAVCAEYSRKTENREPVRFGLGFTRVHRSLFERLASLETEQGQDAVEQFFCQGQLIRDYFPMITLGDGRRPGEDGGFWTLVRLAGIVPRIEMRTRLVHWGTASYPYVQGGMMCPA